MKKAKDSPAMALLRQVWENQGHQNGHSWERINSGMRRALGLAVEYGLRFDRDDFTLIGAEFRADYWLDVESLYAVACGSERGRSNPSAVSAIEAHKKRRPFIIRQADEKTGRRIYVGRRFHWYDLLLTCTSFGADYLTACSYSRPKGESCPKCHRERTWPQEKVIRRVKIDHAAIKAYHAHLKLAEETGVRLKKLDAALADRIAKRMQKRFGKDACRGKFSEWPAKQLACLAEWVRSSSDA